MMLLVGLGHWLTEHACNQNMVQKYCASASTREARRALWIGCVWMLPLWIGFQFLGTALWVFFQRYPTPTSTGILAGTVTAERIVPHFVVMHLPTGFKGLVVAGVLAAAMSTLNSALNAIATVGVVDVYRRHVAKSRDDRHYLLVARSLSWLATLAMVAGALLLLESPTKTLEDAALRLIAPHVGRAPRTLPPGSSRSAVTEERGHRHRRDARLVSLSRRLSGAVVPGRPAVRAARRRARVLHGAARTRLDVRRRLGSGVILPPRRTLQAATEAIGA